MTTVPSNPAPLRPDQDEGYGAWDGSATTPLPVIPPTPESPLAGGQPLFEHLEELRWRLVRVLIAVVLASIIGASFAFPIVELLKIPAEGVKLIRTGVTEMIGLYMKVSLYTGLVLAFPVALYQAVAFIMPGLTRQERRWVLIMIPAALGAFLAGAAFCFFVLLPPAMNFLLHFGEEVAEPFIRIGDYISTVLSMVFWVGATFETPLVIFVLARVGVVTPEKLAGFRRWAVVIAFVAGAMITPTFDPFNQTLVALPLMVLYEVGIQLSKIAVKMRASAAND